MLIRRKHQIKSSLTTISDPYFVTLTAIIGSTDLLELDLGDELGEDQHKLLATIRDSSEQLLEMINESLDMHRIEAGKMTIHAEVFDADRLVAELVDAGQGLASRGRNRLRVVGAGTAGELHTDRAKVRQCLLNLLTNAAKFTDDGEITLSVDRCANPERVRFCVRDTGIGIEADKLDRIFEPFSQATEATATHYGGTGLGLSIARNFARLLGGELEVDSTPGNGSQFTMSLPVSVPAGRGGARQETS